jgi:hypothetical protein
VTAIADLIDPVTRRRLLERLDELADLDRLMRKPGTLAAPRENREDANPGRRTP